MPGSRRLPLLAAAAALALGASGLGRTPGMAASTLKVDNSNSVRIAADYHARTAHPYAQDLRCADHPGAIAATVG
ncbi:hypothetical protein OG782_36680 [Streptomyces sp. NBC_00876]|uniref:hypothetical protein n=1 Tax=Streptomyces sp. NBC_00876 TaxID=2975853 RepID=UPI003870774D|nr:hypothetical protein OG782_36680 [Streptomyces sp. NBC_00876]